MNTREHLIWTLCNLNPLSFSFFTAGISYLSWSLSQGPSQTVFTITIHMYTIKLSDKQFASYQLGAPNSPTLSLSPSAALLLAVVDVLVCRDHSPFCWLVCSVSLHLHFSDSSKYFFSTCCQHWKLVHRLFSSIVVVASRAKYLICSIYN